MKIKIAELKKLIEESVKETLEENFWKDKLIPGLQKAGAKVNAGATSVGRSISRMTKSLEPTTDIHYEPTDQEPLIGQQSSDNIYSDLKKGPYRE